MSFYTNAVAALGRLALALIFILSGLGKLAAPDATMIPIQHSKDA